MLKANITSQTSDDLFEVERGDGLLSEAIEKIRKQINQQMTTYCEKEKLEKQGEPTDKKRKTETSEEMISERQNEEITALESIYDDFYFNKDRGTGIISIKPALDEDVTVYFEEATTKVSFLPPISLKVNLRSEYPERAPPTFTLSCSWLDVEKLEILHNLLLETFEEDTEVLFTWINFIQDSIYEALSFSDGIIIEKSQKVTLKKLPSGHIVRSEYRDGTAMFPNLVEYNNSSLKAAFNTRQVDCEICLSSKLGGKCSLLSCGHIFCRECLGEFFRVMITDGTVLNLKCPSCKESIAYSILKDCVSIDLFNRFEELMLQKGLDGMDDIGYCPRPSCRMPSILLSKEDRICVCSVCQYAFCNICFRSSHFPSPCPVNSKEVKKIIGQYEAAVRIGDNAAIERIMKQYGKNISSIIDEHKSMKYIKENSIPCPKCNQAINKSDGCNKMVCGTCGAYFCYLCGGIVDRQNPYSHFNSSTGACFGRLFEGAVEDGYDDFYLY